MATPEGGSTSPQPPPEDGVVRTLGDGTPIPPGMTKSAFKKARRRADWEAGRDDRKAAAKEKRKEKEQARKAERQAMSAEERAALHEQQLKQTRENRLARRMSKGPFGANVVIDCAFDELMTDREIQSMCQQLSFCYASNKRSPAPFTRLILAGPSKSPALDLLKGNAEGKEYEVNESAVKDGFVGRMEEAGKRGESVEFGQSRLGKLMDANGDRQWRRWKKVDIIEKGGLEALWQGTEGESSSASKGDDEKQASEAAEVSSSAQQAHPSSSSSAPRLRQQDVIYLTADTGHTITSLDPTKTYVIGGLVDRNRYKNLCLRKAEHLGITAARLPIDAAFLPTGKHLSSRKVLTVNQVLDILLGWTEQKQRVVGEGEEEKEPSWMEALQRGLPGRKFCDAVDGEGSGEGGVKRKAEADDDGEGEGEDGEGEDDQQEQDEEEKVQAQVAEQAGVEVSAAAVDGKDEVESASS